MKKSVKEKVDNIEEKAQKLMLQELFQDFNRNRFQIYKLNLVRGIFFGFGSVLGGPVVIAILIWILAALANIVPPLNDFVQALSSALEASE